MEQIKIAIAVKYILDEHSAIRACGSCPIGCSDLTRFICAGFSIEDIYTWCDSHKEFLDKELDKRFY